MPDENKDFVIRDKRFSADSEDAEEKTAKDEPEMQSEPAAEMSGHSKEPDQKTKAMEITFSTFVLSLSSSAAMNLGGYQDPASGHIPKNLEQAKQSIDILGILRDKTKGNLTKEEETLIDSALYELRLRYVEELKKG